MECSIYDTQLTRIGVLYSWVSLDWNERYNELGSALIELQLSAQALDLVKMGRYIKFSTGNTVQIIKSIEIKNKRILVNAVDSVCILDERVSTEVIENQNAEQAIRGLVAAMDPWPCVELGESGSIPDIYAAQTSDGSVWEYANKIGIESDIGLRMRHDTTNRKLLFECYKPPVNANERFSTDYGNMGDTSYIASSVNYKNVAIVAGEGRDQERITVTCGATDSAGADRREMYIDARSERMEDGESLDDYKARLQRYGLQKLAEAAMIEQVGFGVSNEAVKLGDIVSCNLADIGLKAQARVTSVEYLSENNSLKKSIGVGTPVIISRR